MTHTERFQEFHTANPNVYDWVVQEARSLKARGFRNYSIKTLLCIARWHLQIDNPTDPQFKINDIVTSRYARLVMEQETDLQGFFRLRNLRSL